MKRTLAPTLTAVALVAAACTSSGTPTTSAPIGSEPPSTDPSPTEPPSTGPGPTDPDQSSPGPVGFAPASLQQFDDCSSFLDYVHTEGVARVGPYGLDEGGFFGIPELAFEERLDDGATEADVASPDGDTPAVSTGGSDGTFSSTNVQVDGVDEPDIVKTDGDRIVAITGETLHYIDVSQDATSGVLRGSIDLTSDTSYGYGHELFIHGDRAIIFAQRELFADDVALEPLVEADVVDAQATGADAGDGVDGDLLGEDVEVLPVEPDAPIGGPIAPDGYAGPQTIVIEVDLADPDELDIVNTMRVDGRYISARSIADTARLVVTSPPQDLGFLYPSNPGTEDKAEEANRQVIVESTVEDWIPGYTVVGADGDIQTGQLVDCGDIHAPADFGGFDMLSIVTLDLGAALTVPTATSSVMASGDTVYASQDRLYVTTNIWAPVIDEQTDEWLDENYETAVHRFSIAGDAAAEYEASGSVDGHLLNQFSMNDRDGILYVATTTGAPWSGNGSESQIVAMGRDGRRLVEVGQVGELGKGERIFSVRYVGDTAYVVTFRQIDPFYVIDLSDPTNMSVQGELKIPGFSSYLHPISDDFVLGVGQDATDEGRTTGTKVSLFDVSNPAEPLEVDVWTLPDAYSDAEFDHRAFLWWAPTDTAVLPLQSWSDQFAGAVVLKIQDGAITEQGRIEHRDDEQGPIGQTDCRVLTAEEIGGEDNELFWSGENGGQAQACGPNDRGGAIGLFCNPIPIEDLEVYYWNGEPMLDTAGVERVEICWPDWNGYQVAVQRTMVIDGSLWTLSPARLQSNDLVSLARTDAIAL